MSQTMLAARLYGPEDMRLVDVPVPKIGDGEVLLRVKAAAICGTDVRMYVHGMNGVDQARPLTLGHELSGIITAVGRDVQAYRPGMRVAVAPNMGCGICRDCIRGSSHMCRDYRALGISIDGGFAEYAAIPETAVRAGNIMAMHDQLDFAEAAIIEALSCVFNGSEQCAIRPGDTVLVIGAGPIGIMHAMMAKLSGAGAVYVNDISQERLDIARQIDPFFKTVRTGLRDAILTATDNAGADVVVTACPIPDVQKQAIELAANFGRICFFGGLPDDRKHVELNTNLIHYRQLTVTGTTRASLLHFRKALALAASGQLPMHRLITRTVPLSEIGTAMAVARSGSGLKNVVVMP